MIRSLLYSRRRTAGPASPTATAGVAPSAWLPGLFVLLWASGFIGTKLCVTHADPMTFLALRFAIVAALLGVACLIGGVRLPTAPRTIGHMAVAGVLLHGLYLGGVSIGLHRGVSSSVSALIVGLQPLLTAVLVGPLLGETVGLRRWIGFIMGFAGVALVVGSKLDGDLGSLSGILYCVVGLVGITAGTLYQKRFGGTIDLRASGVIQFAAASLFSLIAASATEDMRIDWTGSFIFGLAWLVLVLSIGAISLLMVLIRQGSAARTASLFYLVPPVTALMAWGIFDETLHGTALAGMVLVGGGVMLANKGT